MTPRLLVVASVTWALCGAAVRAQDAHPIDRVRESARTHVGPLYITPALQVRDFGWDNNVFNEPEDPKSDFTFTIAPRAELAVPFARRVLLRGTAGADLVYFRTFSSERSVNPRASGRVEVYLHRVTVFAEPSFLATRQRPNFEIDARSRRDERSLTAGAAWQYSPKLGFELGGRQFRLEYDRDARYFGTSLQETLNRESRSVQAAVKYAFTPFTTVVIRGEATRDRFEFSPDRDADTVRIAPGVEFNPRALIAGSAYVGMRKFDTKSAALEDFRGVVASAELSYTLLGRTAFIFTADRDVTYSYERFQPYYVVDGYGLTIRHRLPGRFDVTLGASRHQYTYRDLVLGGPLPGPERRTDVTRNLNGSVGYNFGPDTRLGLGVSYWQRESNSSRFRDYDALRIGTSLNYGF